MNELAAILSAFAESQWPPSIIVGLVLYWAIDQRFKRVDEKMEVRFNAQDQRLDRIEGALTDIKDQGTQNAIKTAVLEERMRWLEPEARQRRAASAAASAAEEANAPEVAMS